jgi:hypothetical protein
MLYDKKARETPPRSGIHGNTAESERPFNRNDNVRMKR